MLCRFVDVLRVLPLPAKATRCHQDRHSVLLIFQHVSLVFFLSFVCLSTSLSVADIISLKLRLDQTLAAFPG